MLKMKNLLSLISIALIVFFSCTSSENDHKFEKYIEVFPNGHVVYGDSTITVFQFLPDGSQEKFTYNKFDNQIIE